MLLSSFPVRYMFIPFTCHDEEWGYKYFEAFDFVQTDETGHLNLPARMRRRKWKTRKMDVNFFSVSSGHKSVGFCLLTRSLIFVHLWGDSAGGTGEFIRKATQITFHQFWNCPSKAKCQLDSVHLKTNPLKMIGSDHWLLPLLAIRLHCIPLFHCSQRFPRFNMPVNGQCSAPRET